MCVCACVCVCAYVCDAKGSRLSPFSYAPVPSLASPPASFWIDISIVRVGAWCAGGLRCIAQDTSAGTHASEPSLCVRICVRLSSMPFIYNPGIIHELLTPAPVSLLVFLCLCLCLSTLGCLALSIARACAFALPIPVCAGTIGASSDQGKCSQGRRNLATHHRHFALPPCDLTALTPRTDSEGLLRHAWP